MNETIRSKVYEKPLTKCDYVSDGFLVSKIGVSPSAERLCEARTRKDFFIIAKKIGIRVGVSDHLKFLFFGDLRVRRRHYLNESMKIKMILISLVAHCFQLLGQDITKEHWASCLQITKEDKTYSGLTISSLSLYEFKKIIRFKGETEGWHRFGVGVSGGFNDGSQTVLLIKLGEDGLWAKKAEQDEAELVCPFPLAVGQKWMRGEQTCCLSGIRDFEGEEGTYEDCLVFEIENKQGGETVKSEIWYAPEVGQIFLRTRDDKYSRTLRRTR